MASYVVRAGAELRDRGNVLQQNSDHVLAELSCVTCGQFVRSSHQGFLCENMHYYCSSCAHRGPWACSRCPSTIWTRTPQISRLVALVLRNELASCIYNKRTKHFDGCGLQDRYETLVYVHENRCAGRLVSCPGIVAGLRNTCRFSNRPIQMLEDHMRSCLHVGQVSSELRCEPIGSAPFARLSDKRKGLHIEIAHAQKISFHVLQTMRRFENSGSFHYTAYKHGILWTDQLGLWNPERAVGQWMPQFMCGKSISKFLIIFKLIFFENHYIFALTSLAPDDVCAGISARIRVFQTASDCELASTNTTWEFRRAAAMKKYDTTRLLPRIDWLGNVFPAHMTIKELARQPGCLVLPASTIDILAHYRKQQLCEVLVDLEFSKNNLTQQDLCVVDDKTEPALAADLFDIPLCTLVNGITPRRDPQDLLQDGNSDPDTRDISTSDAIIQEASDFMGKSLTCRSH
jgi:hypothetical protein